MKSRSNVTIDSKLLKEVREMKISISPVVEKALREKVAEEKERRWKEANKASIQAYSSFVVKQGLFSDGMRTF